MRAGRVPVRFAFGYLYSRRFLPCRIHDVSALSGPRIGFSFPRIFRRRKENGVVRATPPRSILPGPARFHDSLRRAALRPGASRFIGRGTSATY
jgi:hypothetical protein